MNTSRRVLLPVLAVALVAAIWLGGRLVSHPADELGAGAILSSAEPQSGAGIGDLQASPHEPSELQAADADAAAEPTPAAAPAPPEPSHTVEGHVVLLDGGALPEHLALHASRQRPWPQLSSIRGMIDGDDKDDFPGPAVSWNDNKPSSTPAADLTKASRVEVRPDLTFSMPAVPDSGAFVAVEDELLYADPTARIAAGEVSAEVRLRRGATIEGRVADAQGAAVAGARVAGGTVFDPFMAFDNSSRMITLKEQTTDADGRYRFTQVPAGTALVLAAGKSDSKLQPVSSEVAPLQAGESRGVDLQLGAAASIAGRVRRADGSPLASARVEARRTDFNMKQLSMAGMALNARADHADTDETGAFRFEDLADGSYDVLLQQKGFRPAHVSVAKLTAAQPVNDVELLAEAGLSVSGRVLDPAGQPVPKAWVRGFLPPSMFDMRANMDRESRESVYVDEQGHFELVGYDPGKVRVSATGEGFQSAHVDVEAGATDVVVTLERSCELSGIVVSLADGEPVTRFSAGLMPAGGLIDLTDPMGMSERMEGAHPREKFTDREDGKFTLSDLRAGKYDFNVSAEGFGRLTMKNLEIGKEGRRGLVVMLPPEAVISGIVVDGKTGLAVEGARIETVQGSMMENMVSGMLESRPEATSDASGRFRLGGLSQDPIKLAVKHSAFRDLGVAELALAPGEQRDLGLLQLQSGGAIYGKVTDALGHGVPGVKVMVSEATGRSFKRASTDDQGSYRVAGLPSGAFNVMRMDFTMDMGGEGGAMDFLKDMVFEVVNLAADEEKEVNLKVKTAAGTRIFGDVLAAGGPVAGAMITVLPENGGMSGMNFATTDKEGRYELTGVKPGVYALQVVVLENMSMASGSPATSPVIERLTVAGGEQRHDVRLPGGTLTGVIESSVDGSHVPGVRVVLERTDEGLPKVGLLRATGGRVAETYSGKDGGFAFHYLPEGTFTVVAGGKNMVGMGAAGWAVARVPDVAVKGGGPGFTLHVKVAPGGVVAGRVTDTAQSPLAGVSLWFMDPAGHWLSQFSEVTTDAGGAYSADCLSQGLWSVAFRDGSHALQIVPDVNVATGKTTPLDVVLQPGVVLELATGDRDPWSLQVFLDGPDGPLPTELVSMDQLVGGGDDGVVMKLGVFASGAYHLKVMAGADKVLDTTVVLVGGSGPKVVSLGS